MTYLLYKLQNWVKVLHNPFVSNGFSSFNGYLLLVQGKNFYLWEQNPYTEREEGRGGEEWKPVTDIIDSPNKQTLSN